MDQFTLLPHSLLKAGLNTKDLLVYVNIRRHESTNNPIFPSIQRLVQLTGLSKPIVIKSIQDLEHHKFISTYYIGRKKYFTFTPVDYFEVFSLVFLDCELLTTKEKCYLLGLQQYMYKDVKDFGKVSYTNKQIAELLNMSERAVRVINKSLENKGLLISILNKKFDLETQSKTDTKIFNLKAIGQDIIWEVQNRSLNNTAEIRKIKKALEKQDQKIDAYGKLFSKMFESVKKEKNIFIL